MAKVTDEFLDQVAALLVPRLEAIADRNPSPAASNGARLGWASRRGETPVQPERERTVRTVTDRWLAGLGLDPKRIKSIGVGAPGVYVTLFCESGRKGHLRGDCPEMTVLGRPNDLCVETVTLDWESEL